MPVYTNWFGSLDVDMAIGRPIALNKGRCALLSQERKIIRAVPQAVTKGHITDVSVTKHSLESLILPRVDEVHVYIGSRQLTTKNRMLQRSEEQIVYSL
jgi:hypothetical protein